MHRPTSSLAHWSLHFCAVLSAAPALCTVTRGRFHCPVPSSALCCLHFGTQLPADQVLGLPTQAAVYLAEQSSWALTPLSSSPYSRAMSTWSWQCRPCKPPSKLRPSVLSSTSGGSCMFRLMHAWSKPWRRRCASCYAAFNTQHECPCKVIRQ